MLTANWGIVLAFYVTLQHCTNRADLKNVYIYIKIKCMLPARIILMIFMMFGSVIGCLACILLSKWMQQNLILKQTTMSWIFSFCKSKAYSMTSEV